MPKRITKEDFLKAAKKLGFDCDYSEISYVNATTRVAIKCNIHGFFTQLPWLHLKGHGCARCGRSAGALKHMKARSRLDRLKARYPNYDFSESVYTGMRQKLRYKCAQHGYIEQEAQVLARGSGCPQCAKAKCCAALAFSKDEFTAKARAVHPAADYDYSKVVYKNNTSIVTIGCPAHGFFNQRAANHLRGEGCSACSNNRSLTTAMFVQRARAVHGDAYSYESAVYAGGNGTIRVVCPVHGVFKQRAGQHLSGRGCSKCGTLRASVARKIPCADLIEKASKVHNGNYGYDQTSDSGTKNKVRVQCQKHGFFSVTWDSHINAKSGCPKCNFLLSRGEQAVADWIRSLGVTIEQRNRRLIKPQELDIIVHDRKLAIEYNGVYWHSAPIADRRDPLVRNYHATKSQRTLAAGYRLLTVWETDWYARPDTVKHWLQHQLGLSPKLCGARQCDFEPVANKEAQAFYTRYHLQGACSSGKHFGLYRADTLVAMMTLSRSASDRKSGTAPGAYWLTRFALAGSIPGAATRLFKASVAAIGATEVVTYSDHTYASGNIYASLGFTSVAQLKPDYQVYHPFYGIRHKSFWQRKSIPDRIRELGSDTAYDPASDPRTEFDMEEALGCRHVWDAGKTRWHWAAATAS